MQLRKEFKANLFVLSTADDRISITLQREKKDCKILTKSERICM